MSNVYYDYSIIFKALSDETRLKIVDMLSCGELCACDILNFVDISQSTLSYHMKILTDTDLISSKKDGSWVRYSINETKKNELLSFIKKVTETKEECICKDLNNDFRNCCVRGEDIVNENRNLSK